MTYEEAYKCLLSDLESRGLRIVERRFDDRHFGNFGILFRRRGWKHALINDRGQLVCESQPWFRRRTQTLADDLGAVSCAELRGVLDNFQSP